MRLITVERGFDPRDFALMAFGGAGPMHACELALDLGIGHVMLPRNPGLLCAWGALSAPLGREYSMTVRDSRRHALARLLNVPSQWSCVRATELAAQGVRRRPRSNTEMRADLRYRGQSFEIEVPLSARLHRRFPSGASAHLRLCRASTPQLKWSICACALRPAGPSINPRGSPAQRQTRRHRTTRRCSPVRCAATCRSIARDRSRRGRTAHRSGDRR